MEEVTGEARPPIRQRSAQAWLREHTSQAHADAERAVMRALTPITRASYGAYLQRVHRLFATLEPLLWSACGSLVPDAELRGKTAWLSADLAALGLGPEPDLAGVALPSWDDPLHALGAAYVIEGSTLGGPVLLERVRAADALAGGEVEGARFLSGYGENNATMWRAFRGALSAAAERAHDWAPLGAGAHAMFRAYEAAVQPGVARAGAR